MKRKYLLVIIIIVLLCINVSGSFIRNSKFNNNYTNSLNGDTFFVGGSGPSNYTTIQSAIDDALDGDTVFVYNDSSPYYEHLQINKSINLIGEEKSTTIIDGNWTDFVIKINADFIYVRGFTIQYGILGIYINSNNNTITDNIIILNYEEGIYLSDSQGSTISYNIISENEDGIELENSKQNTILKNNISNNSDHGMEIISDEIILEGNLIESNNIEYNTKGIYIENSNGNLIKANNFIKNQKSALFFNCKNTWNQNYWDKGRILPKLIFGKNMFGNLQIPWINIDWKPSNTLNLLHKTVSAIIDTNMGFMILEIYYEAMPITSSNFKNLADINFFDGLVFHRVIENFVIQGGGYYPDGTYKNSPFGSIPLETHPEILHVDGAISMARTSDPNSATSQFFICDISQPHLDGSYAAFGRIVEGFDVLRDISGVETTTRYGLDDWPIDDIVINSITIEDWS